MALPVLYRNFFQFGYVVRDIEGAIETMKRRMGVTEWKVNRLPPSAPGRTLAFAYVDGRMIELVDLRPGEDTIYHAWIPERDDEVRLHHLGYLIESEADWHGAIGQYEAAGFAPALVGGVDGRMQWYYSDTVATLGHYCELIRFTSEAGKSYWADVPHN
jgi:hypothetical protein